MRGRLCRGTPYGSYAAWVTRAMVTQRLQLVLWPPWPQPLQYTSRTRYYANSVGCRSHLDIVHVTCTCTCSTCRLHVPDPRPLQCSTHTPSATVGVPYEATPTQNYEMCVQLLPSKAKKSTRWYASQWQAIGQLYTHMNHHSGAWAERHVVDDRTDGPVEGHT
jgi:hypothetical protein